MIPFANIKPDDPRFFQDDDRSEDIMPPFTDEEEEPEPESDDGDFTESHLLEHTPGGHEHDQKKHGRKGALPSATDEKQIDDAKERAKAGGFLGFFADEGKGEPPSVYFLDKTLAFRNRVRKLPQKKSGAKKTVKLYRGISTGSPSKGHYYTTDREWARQFTQSGQDKEIRTIEVYLSDIMDDANGES